MFIKQGIDKLMIVAHPDDELLWGGANLASSSGWHVVVSTHKSTERRAEFIKTMAYLGVTSYELHDVDDVYTDDSRFAEKLFKGSKFESRIKQLAKKQWSLVITHNDQGEYGHEHHVMVHKIVLKYFPNANVFQPNPKKLHPSLLTFKKQAAQFYAPTQYICELLVTNQIKKMSKVEQEHIVKETIYTTASSSSQQIPGIFHQIWLGTKPPSTVRNYLFKKNKGIIEHEGLIYKLWTSKDFTFENFPLTWNAMQKSLKAGEANNVSRWAQVADLARYEIVYKYGGVYLDSLFEISDRLWPTLKRMGNTFIGCNEDPCGLQCKSSKKRYLSNGFFASVPKHTILKRVIDKILDERSIDYNINTINKTTGPYLLRSCVTHRDDIGLLRTEHMYPFMVNDSRYRKARPNKCLSSNTKGIRVDNKALYFEKDCLKTHYPKALAIYNSGLGGTWSW